MPINIDDFDKSGPTISPELQGLRKQLREKNGQLQSATEEQARLQQLVTDTEGRLGSLKSELDQQSNKVRGWKIGAGVLAGALVLCLVLFIPAQQQVEPLKQQVAQLQQQVAQLQQEGQQQQQQVKQQRDQVEQQRQQVEQLRKLEPRAEIEKIWTDHNVTRGEDKGMLIHTKFKISNLQGVRFQAIACFFQDNAAEEPLKTSADGFQTSDQHLCVWDYFTPEYQFSGYDDLTLFLPYRAINLGGSGKWELKYYVTIRRADQPSQELAQSDWERFQLTQ